MKDVRIELRKSFKNVEINLKKVEKCFKKTPEYVVLK